MRGTIWGVLAAVAIAGVILNITGRAPAKEGASSAVPGVKAAEFILRDIDGKPVKLSDYKGKVVILDFWATWCPPCVKEIPHFNELTKDYAAKGLVVLGVSVDKEGVAAVQKFKKKNEVAYRVAMVNDSTYKQYQSYLPEDERGGIPFTFVIDKEGVIRQHYVGYRPKEIFEGVIKGLMTDD